MTTAEISRSRFANSALSGVEINQVPGCTIDHCIFEGNAQCGLLAIEAKIDVKESDFVRNRLTGLDFRTSKFTVTKSVALENLGGGFAFRKESTGEIVGGGAGSNQQFGLGVFDKKTVIKSEDFRLIENDHLALLASGGVELTLTKAEIAGQPTIALLAEGRDTRISGDAWTVEENGLALQLTEGVTLRLRKSHFRDNAMHVEATQKARLIARDTDFAQAGNGIGVLIATDGLGDFTNCTFTDDPTAAIAAEGTLKLAASSIVGCGTCGVYLYGNANAELSTTQISGNGACGVQVMAGKAVLTENTIADHTMFGVHVHSSAQIEDRKNSFNSNYLNEINYEKAS